MIHHPSGTKKIVAVTVDGHRCSVLSEVREWVPMTIVEHTSPSSGCGAPCLHAPVYVVMGGCFVNRVYPNRGVHCFSTGLPALARMAAAPLVNILGKPGAIV